MTRVTIKEIARRSGVSQGAVSYALNNRPGVSAATRARVLRVAAELEWVPNRAARQLSAARSETFGLVLARTPQTLTEEPYFMGFVGGVESVLAEHSYALALQVVADLDEEMSTYRKWAAERRVDGVLVVDLRVRDPRIPVLRKLGLPAVLVGDPALADGMPCVWNDSTAAMNTALDHVASLGHRVIARIAGPTEFGEVWIRDHAFNTAVRRLNLTATIHHTNYSATQGATATHQALTTPPQHTLPDSPPATSELPSGSPATGEALAQGPSATGAATGQMPAAGASGAVGALGQGLSATGAAAGEMPAAGVCGTGEVLAEGPSVRRGVLDRPTAIVYDNDLMAVAGLAVVQALGLRIPDDVALVAWDDSALCRITHPTLTALSHDVVGYGAEAARRLFDVLAGAPPQAHLYSTPILIIRESSAPPPAVPPGPRTLPNP